MLNHKKNLYYTNSSSGKCINEIKKKTRAQQHNLKFYLKFLMIPNYIEKDNKYIIFLSFLKLYFKSNIYSYLNNNEKLSHKVLIKHRLMLFKIAANILFIK